MTQVFAEDGTMVPVSVLSIEPNTVTELRTLERDGYTAVQVGAGTAKRTQQAAPGPAQGPARACVTCASSASTTWPTTRSARRST